MNNHPNKSVLIISYYWPPCGGAGVQRWVKLTKYLARLGVECFVVTVDEKEASYMQFDSSLAKDIDKRVKVYKTKSWEPILLYARLFGKKNVPTAGFSNVDNSSFKQKGINFIRSNFFIPDPRIGWKKYALKQAKELIKKHHIKTIITTSPPHSTQMVGLALKRWDKSIKWVVDLRDPWTDIYYYSVLNHSKLSHYINKKMERLVLSESDQIITVSNGFKNLFAKKIKGLSKKIDVIHNGYDHEDFAGLEKSLKKDSYFTITYTGTMSDQYSPEVIIDIIKEINEEDIGTQIRLQVIGSISKSIEKYIKDRIPFDLPGPVPHNQVNKFQIDADCLLLIIPDIENGEGIIPGKLFEYIASKNPIFGLGPADSSANKILADLKLGKVFDRSEKLKIKNFILEKIKNQKSINLDKSIEIGMYSRAKQAEKFLDIII